MSLTIKQINSRSVHIRTGSLLSFSEYTQGIPMLTKGAFRKRALASSLVMTDDFRST